MSGFKTLRDRKLSNGTHDLILSGPKGVTLQGCGLDREETISRIKARIQEIEDRLEWPEDDAIIDAISGEFDAVQI